MITLLIVHLVNEINKWKFLITDTENNKKENPAEFLAPFILMSEAYILMSRW